MSDLAHVAGYCRLGPFLLRPGAALRLSGLALLCGLFGGMALTLGSQRLDLWAVLAGSGSPDDVLILTGLRLPRILVSVLCGGMLGMAGAAMQSLTRNGLADPGLVGTKEGAVIAILLLVLGFPTLAEAWRPWAGMAGALAVTLTVMLIARSLAGIRFILVGIGVGWALSAGLALFITTARIDAVQMAMIWLAGSLHAASWAAVWLTLPWGIAGGGLLLLTARQGEAASLGPLMAVGLGLHLQRLQVLRLAAVVALTAGSVSAIGSLGFVGLVAPHLARLAIGRSEGAVLLGSALLGGLLVLAADSIGRSAFAPVQIPAGIVIALLGGPVLLLLLWRRRHSI